MDVDAAVSVSLPRMSKRVLAILLALVVFITVGMYLTLQRSGNINKKALDEAVVTVPAKKKPKPE